jgi:hypothetical protein
MQAKTRINERIIGSGPKKSQRLIARPGTARQSPCSIKDLSKPGLWQKPQQASCPSAFQASWEAIHGMKM